VETRVRMKGSSELWAGQILNIEFIFMLIFI
jgi:hypothetical protein